jgi:hypothetical protein
MSNQYEQEILTCLSGLGLDSIAPNEAVFREALSLAGEDISSMPINRISKLIFTLSQYQVYLQLQANIQSAKYRKAKRDFELELNRTLIQVKESKMTIKEKTAKAFEINEQLSVLEEAMTVAEGKDIALHKIPESALEIINALKKELSIRGLQKNDWK